MSFKLFLSAVIPSLFVLLISGTAFAISSPPTAPQTPNPKAKIFSIPPHAQKISPNLYDLGQKDVEGKLAQGYAFIHYKDPSDKSNFAKKPEARPRTSACYGFLSKGARWKITEPYILEATNSSGLSAEYIASTSASSMNTWDNQVPFNIFGSRAEGVVDGADTVAPDGKNEIFFGPISDSGVIAVTIVWGYFSGSASQRSLLEYDMIFDDMDFRWGDASADPTVMDFQNITTHELGHAAGMADLYTTSCNRETMYGYATEGETQKRDLNLGDITGVKKLYSN